MDIRCEKCKHKDVCKHENDMIKFTELINSTIKSTPEYQKFHVDIKCRCYLSEADVLTIRDIKDKELTTDTK